MAHTNPSAAIALNRFGLGARPDEPVPQDPRRWLLDQFGRYQPRPVAWAALPTSDTLLTGFLQQQRDNRQQQDADDKKAAQQSMRRELRSDYLSAVQARAQSALDTPAPFVERLVHFWANHFALSVDKVAIVGLAGGFEAEAIRPHVLGRFEDMLLAAERHPAMLLYLDQARSIGPGSMAATRAAQRNPQQQRGLNENLAREIMELHTLGVRSGYSQEDVTEFARALTGWSIGGTGPGARFLAGAGMQARNAAGGFGRGPAGMAPPAPPGFEPGGFAFYPVLHEPGPRTVMGRRYDPAGEGQARAILHDLAAAPATARHIATKLARHFVADDPPPALVDRLAEAFSRSGGDLPTVYRVLVEAPEAWATATPKFKTPWDWTLSSLRGLGARDVQGLQIAPLLNQLGQPVWRPGSPAGFDDIAASWAAPDALVRRVEVAQRFAARAAATRDARALGASLLPGSFSDATATAVARAESPATGIALLLVSPDFLRR